MSADKLAKKLYLREHSNIIRKSQPSSSRKRFNSSSEDPEAPIVEGLAKYIVLLLCRSKQRNLQEAWRLWMKNTDIQHDYVQDARIVLSRPLDQDELRTELEIEVLYKWTLQVHKLDPTGIAHMIMSCKSKKAIVEVLQHCRLETYWPGDAVVFQGTLPKIEDGLFTIFYGECHVCSYPEDSLQLLRLQYFEKGRHWDEANAILDKAQIIATIKAPAGFGELSTLTNAPRGATVRAKKIDEEDPVGNLTEILIVPKPQLKQCLSAKRINQKIHRSEDDGISTKSSDIVNQDSGEAIEFLRQSGLANRVNPSDLVMAANCMRKRALFRGEVLYLKGEQVRCIFLVVSGEFLLDVADYKSHNFSAGAADDYTSFLNCSPECCFFLGSHSILGDEGIVGMNKSFEASAIVVSEGAMVFEVSGFGLRFLGDRLGASRYSALAYKDLPKRIPALPLAEQVNIYSQLNSLRKAYATSFPFRGSLESSVIHSAVGKRNNHEVEGGVSSTSHKKHGNTEKKIKNDHRAARKSHSKAVGGSGGDSPMKNSTILESESLTSNAGSTSVNDSRYIRGATLHHLLHVAKIVKKRAQDMVKTYAQENLLDVFIQEVGVKNSQTNAKLITQQQKKLEKSINDYKERLDLKNKANLSQESSVHVHLSDASNVANILQGMAAAAMGGVDDDTATHAASVLTNELEDEENDYNDAEEDGRIAALSPMECYIHFIMEKKRSAERTRKAAAEQAKLHAAAIRERNQLKKSANVMDHLATLHTATRTSEGVGDLENGYTTTKSGNNDDSNEPLGHSVPFKSKIPAELGIPWRPPSPSARGVDSLVASTMSVTVSRPPKPQLTAKNLEASRKEKAAEGRLDGKKEGGGGGEGVDADEEEAPNLLIADGNHQTATGNMRHDVSRMDENARFKRLKAKNTRRLARPALTTLPKYRALLSIEGDAFDYEEEASPNATDAINKTLIALEKETAVVKHISEDKVNISIQTYEDPKEFFQALTEKKFEVRMEHRPEFLWNTRLMKIGASSKKSAPDGESEWLIKTLSAVDISSAQSSPATSRPGSRQTLANKHLLSLQKSLSLQTFGGTGLDGQDDKVDESANVHRRTLLDAEGNRLPSHHDTSEIDNSGVFEETKLNANDDEDMKEVLRSDGEREAQDIEVEEEGDAEVEAGKSDVDVGNDNQNRSYKDNVNTDNALQQDQTAASATAVEGGGDPSNKGERDEGDVGVMSSADLKAGNGDTNEGISIRVDVADQLSSMTSAMALATPKNADAKKDGKSTLSSAVRFSEGPSVALAQFDEYLAKGMQSRKYLDGKMAFNHNSRFRLDKKLEWQLEEPVKGDSGGNDRENQALLAVIQANKNYRGEDKDKFDDDTVQDTASFQGGMSRGSSIGTSTTISGHSKGSHSSVFKQSKDIQLAIKQSYKEKNQLQNKLNSIILDSLIATKKPSGSDLDPSIKMWQDFSVETTVKRQSGEKWTLPTLPMRNKNGEMMLNRRMKLGNALVKLPAKADEVYLEGPPTYLEVYESRVISRKQPPPLWQPKNL